MIARSSLCPRAIVLILKVSRLLDTERNRRAVVFVFVAGTYEPSITVLLVLVAVYMDPFLGFLS